MGGVTNMVEVRTALMSGKLAASLVTPRLLCNSLPLIIAIEKAIQNNHLGKMITRTIFTEVLYNLSFTKNITESLKTFGVKESEMSLVAVIFDDTDGQKRQTLEDVITCDSIIQNLPDWTLFWQNLWHWCFEKSLQDKRR